MTTPKYLQLEYIDNCIKQTLLWMNGKSIHLNEECCIDFSCCYPKLLFETEKRKHIGANKIKELQERRLHVNTIL